MKAWQQRWPRWRLAVAPLAGRRYLSASSWERHLAHPVQTYISTSRDPYLNLSIEHDLLQRSAKDSVVLFLYVNRPSVIIGRNQNPWLEVNLPLLSAGRGRAETEPPGLGAVDLVRRRSGGGTVFHDEGNVNWTIICPKDDFTRDKHAEMVVRALRSQGIDRARVNHRHDIVLDQGDRVSQSNPDNTHATPYTKPDDTNEIRPLKVSGSAYKITGKHRALHHGTCLLSSPNLQVIPHYLHSPAKPFIREARGVQSVSSPVGNILLSNDDFCDSVLHAFTTMYPAKSQAQLEKVDECMLEIESIAAGVSELKSRKHTFESTPQFLISNASDTRSSSILTITVRGGHLIEATLNKRGEDDSAALEFDIGSEDARPKLHEFGLSGDQPSWQSVLESGTGHLNLPDQRDLLSWLQRIMPPMDTHRP